jgi:protein-S-isoprenylcysteine O-methyltransferase Ste14
MSSPQVPDRKRSTRIPRWAARLAALVAYGVAPWAISLLASRHGWAAGRPGVWNLLGLVPVGTGTASLFLIMDMHFAHAPEGVKMEFAQNYLLNHGPYAFTRHPMYLSELVVLLGWALFYGSIVVLVGFLVVVAVFNVVNVPVEERALEARFGEAYRQYKSKVPRWFGRSRG